MIGKNEFIMVSLGNFRFFRFWVIYIYIINNGVLEFVCCNRFMLLFFSLCFRVVWKLYDVYYLGGIVFGWNISLKN